MPAYPFRDFAVNQCIWTEEQSPSRSNSRGSGSQGKRGKARVWLCSTWTSCAIIFFCPRQQDYFDEIKSVWLLWAHHWAHYCWREEAFLPKQATCSCTICSVCVCVWATTAVFNMIICVLLEPGCYFFTGCMHIQARKHTYDHMQVADEARASFARALRLPGPDSLPAVVAQACQLWGAGVQ